MLKRPAGQFEHFTEPSFWAKVPFTHDKQLVEPVILLNVPAEHKLHNFVEAPPKLKEPFGQGCLLARRLIERNVRTVEVSFGGWDTHQNNFTSLPELCHTMDQAVAALLDDLQRLGKLQDTIVVLTTEFDRTPLINQNVGRDHYPQAFTSIVAGGGFKGGYVHGKTSEGEEEVIEGAMTIPDFNATIAHGLGIPVDHVLYSPTVRPFTVAHKGKPQLALFS